jgi:aspartokinase-like uncharacterized kinase
MWVVKLGGSLAHSPKLEDWLDLLAAHGGGRVVIVPGGGPFADLVRDAQERWRFDEASAHRMALLAMDQYGLMLAGMQPELVVAQAAETMHAALRNARVPVWLPTRMLEQATDVEPGWQVTSDSLAAWLATRLSAERLILVKSCALPPAPVSAERLAGSGIVDAAFPHYARNACFELMLLNREQPGSMRAMLHAGGFGAAD